MEHPSVLECAVTGEPDPVRGQVVKATIVLTKGYEGSEELKKEIEKFVKYAVRLPNFKRYSTLDKLKFIKGGCDYKFPV